MKLNLIYFSGAGTTQKVVRAIAEGIEASVKNVERVEYPLIKVDTMDREMDRDDLSIFAIPVYAGRVPKIAAEQIRKFKGNDSRAIVVVVYGNREFDDAMLELNDIVSQNEFITISAGAFIAEHSIFPKVAAGRPNKDDIELAKEFGAKSCAIKQINQRLVVPGNYPYKTPGSNPLLPRTEKSKCIKAIKKDKEACGVCAEACPVGAIGLGKPTTNGDVCIKCAHCIAVCPTDARKWGGLIYKIAERKFVANYSAPKQPTIFYGE